MPTCPSATAQEARPNEDQPSSAVRWDENAALKANLEKAIADGHHAMKCLAAVANERNEAVEALALVGRQLTQADADVRLWKGNYEAAEQHVTILRQQDASHLISDLEHRIDLLRATHETDKATLLRLAKAARNVVEMLPHGPDRYELEVSLGGGGGSENLPPAEEKYNEPSSASLRGEDAR